MRRSLKILITAGIALGAAILVPVIHHYQLRAEVNAYIAQLKAKGEPMDLAQVIPPPTPPVQNGTSLVMNAFTNLASKYNSIIETNPPPVMREVFPGKAMVGWQQPNIVGFDDNDLASLSKNVRLWTNTWEDLGKELAAAKSDLDRLQSLTNSPVLDLNVNFVRYGKSYDLQVRYSISLARSARWLSGAAIYDLHERKTAKACADVQAILAIAKGQADEPLEGSQLIRCAIAELGDGVTWEILQDPNVSESDLAALQQDWDSIGFISPARKAFLAERIINLQTMKYFIQNPSDLWRAVSGNPDSISFKLCKLRWRWFWTYADERQMMQMYQVLVDAMRMVQTNHSFQSAQSFVRTNFDRLGFKMPFLPEGTFRIDIEQDDVRWLMSEEAFDSFGLLRRATVCETARNMTIIAIALKRYELHHHQYPATLGVLTPAYLRTIPLDFMNGQTLRYRKNPGGTFLLYSVGEDGVDNGGKPASHEWWEWYWSAHNFDLVWPQPATPQEIRAYYARQKSGN